jgi:3-hydroxybutyryl-CoA dehydrogenase
MTTVGVIGAGLMGVGVAQSMAEYGHPVILVDNNATALARAEEELVRNVRMSRMLGRAKADLAEIAELVTFTTDLGFISEADFVIENVTEDWEIKTAVYPALNEVCKPDVIFAANTSAISITRIAKLTTRPDRVLGIHFMNPVPLKDTVEMIRGWHTADSTIEVARGLLESIGKKSIVVSDSPGFVSNRVLMLTVNEAASLVHENVAPAADIDEIFRSCFEHKMGPLETADLIGLDTILYSINVLYDSFQDSKYRPCPLLKKMVDAGLYGRKSGEGFYRYA